MIGVLCKINDYISTKLYYVCITIYLNIFRDLGIVRVLKGSSHTVGR